MAKKQAKQQDKQYPLDIFEVLPQLDVKNREYYNKPTEDEQIAFEKAFQPLIVMRWFTGTYNAQQIYYINEFVNTNVWSFTKEHKRLLFYLLIVSAQNRRKTNYIWNANQKSVKFPKTTECLQQYFQYSARQAREVIPLLTVVDVIDYATELGMQPDEIKAIKTEFKNDSKNN